MAGRFTNWIFRAQKFVREISVYRYFQPGCFFSLLRPINLLWYFNFLCSYNLLRNFILLWSFNLIRSFNLLRTFKLLRLLHFLWKVLQSRHCTGGEQDRIKRNPWISPGIMVWRWHGSWQNSKPWAGKGSRIWLYFPLWTLPTLGLDHSFSPHFLSSAPTDNYICNKTFFT